MAIVAEEGHPLVLPVAALLSIFSIDWPRSPLTDGAYNNEAAWSPPPSSVVVMTEAVERRVEEQVVVPVVLIFAVPIVFVGVAVTAVCELVGMLVEAEEVPVVKPVPLVPLVAAEVAVAVTVVPEVTTLELVAVHC